jgi:excinuclease ABC subunit C
MPTVRDTLPTIAASPGVYIFKDTHGEPLYIGKAENLRARVRQYFHERGDGRFNVQFLMAKVADVEVITTASNQEAVLLERTLIHERQPRYNIEMRDDKSFLSIRLDRRDPWPWLVPVRTRAIRSQDRRDPDVLLFGPYADTGAMKKTLRLINRIFPLRTCSDHVFRNRSRPCLQHQIGRCVAPCVLDVRPEDYRELVDQAALFLRGRTGEVVDRLGAKMEKHSERMEYEQATALRDRVAAIRTSAERQTMVSQRAVDRDVVAHARLEGKVLLAVFHWRGGVLLAHRTHGMADRGHPPEWLFHEFLSRVFPEEGDLPAELILEVEPHERAMIEQDLSERRGRPVALIVPQRGEKRRLVEMAVQNAEQMLRLRLAGERDVEGTLARLAKKLRLDAPPRWIECFDISTLQGAMTVGAQVVFRDGEPDKSSYRLYRVQATEGQDDFAAMREVLSRRFRRALQEQQDLPDLLIIDGGKGQLGMALEAMRELGVEGVAAVGLAKARPLDAPGAEDAVLRSPERIHLPGRKNPVIFKTHEPALHLITRIRDEAHRFAVTFHRRLRKKANLRSLLDEIPGVGPGRRRALLRHFGSLAKIRAASAEELARAPGVSRSVAEAVHRFLSDPAGPEEG